MKLLLLSGGIDSTCLAFWHRPEFAITINYGQRTAEAEIQASKSIAEDLKLKHQILRINFKQIGLGVMCTSRQKRHIKAPSPEWWPFRNQILLTIGAAYALQVGANEIAIGTVRTDRRHADGTPKFLKTMKCLLGMQEGHLILNAPAAKMTSQQLIKKSRTPSSILGWTHSCHVSSPPCGRCRACIKRLALLKFI